MDHKAALAVLSLRSRLRHSAKLGVNFERVEIKRYMAKSGHLDADRLENCDALVPSALGDSRGAQMVVTKVMM